MNRRKLIQTLGITTTTFAFAGCLNNEHYSAQTPTPPEKRVQTTTIAVTHVSETDTLLVTHSGGAAIAAGETLRVTTNGEMLKRKHFREPVGNGGELFNIENISEKTTNNESRVTVELEIMNQLYEFENTGMKTLRTSTS